MEYPRFQTLDFLNPGIRVSSPRKQASRVEKLWYLPSSGGFSTLYCTMLCSILYIIYLVYTIYSILCTLYSVLCTLYCAVPFAPFKYSESAEVRPPNLRIMTIMLPKS